MIDEMFDLREKKKGLETSIKAIKEEMTLLEARLIEKFDSEDSPRGQGRSASASITETSVPAIEDWDTFEKYLVENDALYLLQRRIATRAFKELKNTGESIPGVITFPKRTISLRKLNKQGT